MVPMLSVAEAEAIAKPAAAISKMDGRCAKVVVGVAEGLALFDISKDISEQNDLAEQMPEKTAELDRLLLRYLNDIDAQMACNRNVSVSERRLLRRSCPARRSS